MSAFLGNPAFKAYALTCVVLCINLVFLWAHSGTVRARTKEAVNKEDADFFGGKLVDLDPPDVARVLRAHANAQAIIYPFFVLGLLFVLAGGGATFAYVVFGVFAVARILHSVVYLAGLQPWRTVTFVVGGLALIALMGDVVWLVIQGPATS